MPCVGLCCVIVAFPDHSLFVASLDTQVWLSLHRSPMHAGIQKVLSGGPTLTSFFLVFLVDEGREDPNTTISGPWSA